MVLQYANNHIRGKRKQLRYASNAPTTSSMHIVGKRHYQNEGVMRHSFQLCPFDDSALFDALKADQKLHRERWTFVECYASYTSIKLQIYLFGEHLIDCMAEKGLRQITSLTFDSKVYEVLLLKGFEQQNIVLLHCISIAMF